MVDSIDHVIQVLLQYCKDQGLHDSCREGQDTDLNKKLLDLGIRQNTGLAQLYKNLLGPFSCESQLALPDLLDPINGQRTIENFTDELKDAYDVSGSVLAISEIDSMVGLFYDVDTDAIYEVEMDLDFALFLKNEMTPRWNSSIDFVRDYFED